MRQNTVILFLKMFNRRSAFRRVRSRTRSRVPLKTEVMRLKKQMSVRPRPELKVLQGTLTFSDVNDAAGSIAHLSAIPQGSELDDRVGDRINVSKINMMFTVTGGSTNTATLLYSFFLVKDLESSGVVPVISGTVQSIFSSFNPTAAFTLGATKERFKILARCDFGGAVLLNGNSIDLQKRFVKTKSLTTYHDTSASQTGAGKNQYYVVMLSNDTADTVDGQCAFEIYFTDS